MPFPFISTFSLLLFSYLFLFSKPLFVTGRSISEVAILILEATCVSIKISYMAIRNIICDSTEEKELLVNKCMATEATGHQENKDRDGGSIGNEQGTVPSRELSSMRRSRSGYVSWLTRIYNEAGRLLISPISTKDEVLGKRDLILTAFTRFEEVHFYLLTLL